MRKLMFPICVAMLAACTGCFTMEKADMASINKATGVRSDRGGEPREHLLVSNYGWYLFNRIPLACGNARKGAGFPWAFFYNDVDESKIQDRFTDYAAENDYDVEDLVMFNSEQVLLDIYSIPIPIPYLCCYREMQLSGVLVKRRTEADEATKRAIEMKREMKALLDRLPKEEAK